MREQSGPSFFGQQCMFNAVMYVGCAALLIKGVMVVGGVTEVWNRARDGRRLDSFLNFDPNPFQYITVWTVLFGSYFFWFGGFTTQQAIQRCLLRLPSPSLSQSSLITVIITIHQHHHHYHDHRRRRRHPRHDDSTTSSQPYNYSSGTAAWPAWGRRVGRPSSPSL